MSKITVQLEPNGPITEIDECQLVKSEGIIDNENERTTWIEYRLASDPRAERAIHRSVHVTLKKKAAAASQAQIGRFA